MALSVAHAFQTHYTRLQKPLTARVRSKAMTIDAQFDDNKQNLASY